MIRRVEYTPEAREQINEIRDYIANAKSVAVAVEYVETIFDLCDGLADFPFRGVARDHLLPGLRTLGVEGKRTLVAFVVADDAVEILGVFYGGQDWERRFKRAHGID